MDDDLAASLTWVLEEERTFTGQNVFGYLHPQCMALIWSPLALAVICPVAFSEVPSTADVTVNVVGVVWSTAMFTFLPVSVAGTWTTIATTCPGLTFTAEPGWAPLALTRSC